MLNKANIKAIATILSEILTDKNYDFGNESGNLARINNFMVNLIILRYKTIN